MHFSYKVYYLFLLLLAGIFVLITSIDFNSRTSFATPPLGPFLQLPFHNIFTFPPCCCIGIRETGRCWPPPELSGGKPYTILWHSNQFGPRGTEIALFDYASSFETYLCGISHVDTFGTDAAMNREPSSESFLTLPKFQARFPGRTHLLMHNGREELDALLNNVSANAFYAIQAGMKSWTMVWPNTTQGNHVKTLLHAVFDGHERHFDSYAVVGDTIPRAKGVPVVHHIVNADFELLRLPGLRSEYNIPSSARVFCRHGGPGTFDIQFVRDAVCLHARLYPKDFFIFLGTLPIECSEKFNNIIQLSKTIDLRFKQRFLNTCNACLHARSDGETFGLGVAECSMTGLPVITFCSPPSSASFHLQVLGADALLYCTIDDVLQIMAKFDVLSHVARSGQYKSLYSHFGPSAIMLEFMVNFNLLDHYMAISNPRNLSWEGNCRPTIPLAQL